MEVPLGDLVDRLGIVNQKIWALESDVRKGKLDGDYLEVGKRAIQIRDLNRERVALRNAINELSGTGFKDIKIEHSSG